MFAVFNQNSCRWGAGKSAPLAVILGAAVLSAGLLLAGTVPVQSSPGPDGDADKRSSESGLTLRENLPDKFGVLGSFEFKVRKHRFQSDWNGLLERAEREKPLYERCDPRGVGDACSPRVRKWRRIIEDLKGRPKTEQLARLNRSINLLIPYADDRKIFGKRDYWATPAESLRSKGDCEDYAIIKFLSLLELGFGKQDMRVVIVRDTRRRLMHAVLSVRLGGKTYILDNLFNHPVEQHHILKYVPLYSANLNAQWVHVTTKKIRAAFVTHVMNGPTRKAGSDERKKVSKKDSANGRLSGTDQAPATKFVDWT